MLLHELLHLYQTAHRCSDGYGYQLGRTIRLWGERLGRAPLVSDLQDDAVSSWLASLEETHARRTVAGHRGNLMILWRFAARRKLCLPPVEVRRCPKPAPMPVAWTVEQVGLLIRGCDLLPEQYRAWMLATVRVCYESGLRPGDVRRIGRDQLRDDGVLVRQHKTGRPHFVGLQPETVSLVRSLEGEYPLACPCSARQYAAMWAALRKAAGVKHGACKQLRVTGASWVAAANGVDAARSFLGHQSGDMWRHYVDLSVAGRKPYLPPKVG